MPSWLIALAWLSVLLGIACAVWIALDETRRPQAMGIMDVVWPVTALYAGPLALWAYYGFGRAEPRRREGDSDQGMGAMAQHGQGHGGWKHGSSGQQPTASQVATGATHCGAGCTLGDLVAEALTALFPAIAVWLGLHTLWSDPIFSSWVLDFVLAFALGILFQYWSIRPMNPGMGSGTALWRALKADTLSLTAWQAGMYAVMGLAHFLVFPRLLGTGLPRGTIVFWFVMQLAMLVGFCTAYPVNRWLIQRGVKEAM